MFPVQCCEKRQNISDYSAIIFLAE